MLGIGFSFSKLTLVVEFLVMAVVLVVRPWGLLGKPQAPSRNIGCRRSAAAPADAPRQGALAPRAADRAAGAAARRPPARPTPTVLAIDLLTAALFAASLHFIMGPAGMHSFGHAAYFGLGAYGAALLVRQAGSCRWSWRWSLAPLVAAARRRRLRLVRVRAVGRRTSRC